METSMSLRIQGEGLKERKWFEVLGGWMDGPLVPLHKRRMICAGL